MFIMQVTSCVCSFAVLNVFLERDHFEKSVCSVHVFIHSQCLMQHGGDKVRDTI